MFQYDFPKVLRVVQEIETLEELKLSGEKRIEVKKFKIPDKGDITILQCGDIFINYEDKQNAKEPIIRQSNAILDSYHSYDSAFFSMDSSDQSSMLKKAGVAVKGVAKTVAIGTALA